MVDFIYFQKKELILVDFSWLYNKYFFVAKYQAELNDVSFDEKELVKKSIKIVPATKERPHVISNTPVYESTGVYRDSKISVMFDKDISEGSIYWTLEELKKRINADLFNFGLKNAAVCLFKEPRHTEPFEFFALP